LALDTRTGHACVASSYLRNGGCYRPHWGVS